jgi:hypothetical protein
MAAATTVNARYAVTSTDGITADYFPLGQEFLDRHPSSRRCGASTA